MISIQNKYNGKCAGYDEHNVTNGQDWNNCYGAVQEVIVRGPDGHNQKYEFSYCTGCIKDDLKRHFTVQLRGSEKFFEFNKWGEMVLVDKTEEE